MKRILLLVILSLMPYYAFATAINWKAFKIPMPQAGSAGLEAIIVWPDDGNKHPLALISHGSPRNGAERKTMTPLAFLPIAEEFARRGFSSVVVLRRGYGGSGGGWVEGFGSCDAADYSHSAQMSAEDLHTAIQYLNTLPQVDTTKIIAVGVSAGGFATVALTALHPPPGLVAAISFAGGRGSQASDKVCQPDKLIASFSALGKTSRIPMLWIYAENDHFFNVKLAKQFYKAFEDNGGQAQLLIVPAYGEEGHMLFSTPGIPRWTPIVDEFLKQHHLVLVDDLLPLPQSELKSPSNLTKKAKAAFIQYTNSAPHKAFAVSSSGGFGWRSGQRSVDLAKQGALDYCHQYTHSVCKIIAIDDVLN